MKKVLIHMRRSDLSPIGGPAGYNYNLAQGLDAIGDHNIAFIELHSGNISSINSKIQSIKIAWLRNLIKIAKGFCRKFQLFYGYKHLSPVDLKEYDIVHFQSTWDMFEVRDSLKKYSGKVVLTSHSPTLLWKEMYSMLLPWEQKYLHWFYKKLERMDVYAFNRADYLVFPCPEAEEPYFNNWESYSELHNKKQYRYLLSGITPCTVKRGKRLVRKELNIPEDAFVISYVGRHNELKGYDILLEIGRKIFKDNANVWFLIAGKEEPLKGLDDSHWIEVGWTNDPHSYIAASDIFVLPNRETYFDLIMLELLSLGQIVCASYTGGNKFFDKLQPNGILTYTSIDEAISNIYEVMSMTDGEKEKIRQLNKTLFNSHFTSKVFAQNYIKMINTIE